LRCKKITKLYFYSNNFTLHLDGYLNRMWSAV
jgi:hypothetical protein